MAFRATPGQVEALNALNAWHRGHKQFFYLAGYAGTGKSTLMTSERVVDMLGGNVVYAAPTHKAAEVLREKLRKKNIVAQVDTLHRLVYRPPVEMLKCEDCPAQARPGHDLSGGTDDCRHPRIAHVPLFRDAKVYKHSHPLHNAEYVVVDEVSMMRRDIMDELLALPVRVIGVGDPFQLPPVEGSAFISRYAADAELNEVTRTALDDPILNLAMRIRTEELTDVPPEDPARTPIAELVVEHPDDIMFITGTNASRHFINVDQRRQRFGYGPSDLPRAGEPIVAKFNYPQYGVTNGAPIFTLEEDARPCRDDSRFILVKVNGARRLAWRMGFTEPDSIARWRGMKPKDRQEAMQLHFAYALTAHASQGSEWPIVVVTKPLRSGSPLDQARWLYTAVTRAQKKLIVP